MSRNIAHRYRCLTAECWSLIWFCMPAFHNAGSRKHLEILWSLNVSRVWPLSVHYHSHDLITQRYTITQTEKFILTFQEIFTKLQNFSSVHCADLDFCYSLTYRSSVLYVIQLVKMAIIVVIAVLVV